MKPLRPGVGTLGLIGRWFGTEGSSCRLHGYCEKEIRQLIIDKELHRSTEEPRPKWEIGGGLGSDLNGPECSSIRCFHIRTSVTFAAQLCSDFTLGSAGLKLCGELKHFLSMFVLSLLSGSVSVSSLL